MPDQNQTKVDKTLQDIRGQEEEARAKATALALGLPYINLAGYPISPDVFSLIPLDISTNLKVITYMKAGGLIKVCTPNLTDEVKSYVASLHTQTQIDVQVNISSETGFLSALSQYIASETAKKEAIATKAQTEKKESFEDIKTLEAVAEKAKVISTSELVNLIFAGAIHSMASDVHIESTETGAKMRYRIDGVLQDVVDLSPEQYKAVVSRIKNQSRLKLDIKTAPQDGRFSSKVAGVPFDVRVSSIPAAYGENIVMRILRQDVKFLLLKDLGMNPRALQLTDEAIEKPHGMILNTGPTGSGKTTTLYAILSVLNRKEVKIITIEDPIEYRISGINQTQVNPSADYTFASALRSAVRQDPDIIMVGEIRDLETAKIALQSSLTGHLVLSSLHTNNAAGAIPRLLELGIEPFLLAGSINLIIAQRLVRRVCVNCQGKGCAVCQKTGYKGRIPIVEALKPTQEFNSLIARKASVDEFERKAVEQGMISMYQDGMSKVAAGLTTKEEVERVTRE